MNKKTGTGLTAADQAEPQARAAPSANASAGNPDLPQAAQRALAEAAERRRQMDAQPKPQKEINGRDGPDPVRYGDWENKGIASDF